MNFMEQLKSAGLPDREGIILLVDDLPDNLYVFSEILEREGYTVIPVQSGREALEVLDEKLQEIDLVLSDVMMPEMTGFELCKLIKENDNTAHIPVILITAQLLDDRHAAKGLEYGADDYISRPISPFLLKRKIESVIERKAVCEKWRDRIEQSKEAIEIKDWHTKMLIHDLRSPLASAMGFLSLLIMDENLKDRQRELIMKIQNAIQKESELLEDMLTLTAVKEGRLELNIETFDLASQIKEALLLAEGNASKRGIRFEHVMPKERLMVSGDRQLLSRVLINLVDNAIKFAPPNSYIVISSYIYNESSKQPLSGVEDGWIVCEVSNLGAPIEASHKELIFEPFVKRPKNGNSNAHYMHGIGLGLAFCREIINAHNGKIGVISPLPDMDEGVRFYFALRPPTGL